MPAELPAMDPSQIKDPMARQGMALRLNLVEESAENQRLRHASRLRDTQ